MNEEELLFVSNDEDPVIEETPVYVNSAAGPYTLLAHFPTRRSTHSDEDAKNGEICQVKFKEQSRLLEFQVKTPIPPNYIDPSRISSGLSKTTLVQPYTGVLTTSETQGGKLAVAYIHDNKVFLTLVAQSAQFRPSFAHSSQQNQTSADNKDQNQSQQSQQPAQPAQPAQLRSVQMSVKSATNEQPNSSSELEFWRQAAKEDNVDYAVIEPENETQMAQLLAKEVSEDIEVNTPKFEFL